MALMQITSPHTTDPRQTSQVMQQVLLATLPGIFALTVYFGWGVLTNIVLASLFAIALEATVLWLRKRPLEFYLRDYSALVTAVLLAIALPPYSAWWLILTGVFFAIVIAKHLYGGMGYNPFNPAMVGYVVLLISFPVAMTHWAAPITLLDTNTAAPGLWQSFHIALVGNNTLDAVSMATPLDLLRQNNALMTADLQQQYSQFGRWGGVGWEWANIGFLAGGLWLLRQKIYSWHAPLSLLAALCLMSAIFYDGGSSNSGGSPLFHCFSGATMLGAWFIATDPVSSAVSNRGKIIFGAGIGVLVFLIRKWGNYPDAIAFAVLLMNFAAPFIDHYSQPKVYGHSK